MIPPGLSKCPWHVQLVRDALLATSVEMEVSRDTYLVMRGSWELRTTMSKPFVHTFLAMAFNPWTCLGYIVSCFGAPIPCP